jgi:aminoglycoside phosphotransferase family enzyme
VLPLEFGWRDRSHGDHALIADGDDQVHPADCSGLISAAITCIKAIESLRPLKARPPDLWLDRAMDALARPSDAPSVDDKVAFLRRAGAFPGEGQAEALQTHMSWVFLTDERAYKLKKPVRFPYLDFSTLDRRAQACAEELRLNRRLAGEVYLGMAPLLLKPEGFRVGDLAPDGPPAGARTGADIVDWLVVMRRLDRGRMLENLMGDGVSDGCLSRLARRLGDFYRHAPRARMTPGAGPARRRAEFKAARAILLDPRLNTPRGLVRRVLSLALRVGPRSDTLVDRRIRRGRIVDGHGDLRPEHIWLGDGVLVIDALEFSASLRAVDPLEEIAFLELECSRLNSPEVGLRLKRKILWRLAEIRSEPLFTYYRSRRALQRARLAMAHLLEPEVRTPEVWPSRARTYLRFALADLEKLNRTLNR